MTDQSGPEAASSAVPGYQPTERLDRRALAAVAEGTGVEPRVGTSAAPRHDTAEIAKRLPTPVELRPAPSRRVEVTDLPVDRIRRPADLVTAAVSVLGIAVVLLLAVFAHATTEGVTEDVQNAIPSAIQSVLLAPVNVLEGVVTFLLPLVIAVERLIRRQPRLVLEAAAAAVVTGVATIGAVWLMRTFAPDVLFDGVAAGTGRVTFVPIIAALSAFLTVVGATDRRGLVSWTWNLLWITLVLLVLRGGMSLPGALASVLIGRAIGLAVRYATGVLGDRAYGSSLLRALRRAGIDPVEVHRVVDGRPLRGVPPVHLTTDAPIGYRTESEIVADVQTNAATAAQERAAADDGARGADPGEPDAPAASDPASPGPSSPAPATATADDGAAAGPAAVTVADPDPVPAPDLASDPAPEPAPVTAVPSRLAPTTSVETATWEVPDDLRADGTGEHAASESQVARERTGGTGPTPAPASSSSDTSSSGTTSRSHATPRAATPVVGEEEGENRVYSVRDSAGAVWDVGVLDDDRQVVGALSSFWTTLRLRGLQRRTSVSLRSSVERATLLAYAAEAAGVRTPRLRGLATEQGSAVLVSEHVPDSVTFGEAPASRLTDAVLDRIWAQLRVAHAAGLAHRELDDSAVLLDAEDRVWLTGWASGEISSPTLARRLDLAQVLAMLALRVGPERALASANRNLNEAQLVSIAPILQPVALPERTRERARADKSVLKEVRELLVSVIPTVADVEPMQLRRFSARTIITVTIAIVAAFILLTAVNINQIVGYVRDANPVWLVIAFALGLVTYLGSAMGLVAFSPVKLPLWRTTLVQVAASVIALVTPAGVGPAALNLRYMQKQKLDTPMALATVTLVQVSQFVTTVLLLLGIALATGSSGALDGLPSGVVLIVIAAIAAVAGALMAFPRIRRWVLAKVTPTLTQVWPRLVWIVGQPGRLLMGLVGNLIMTIGYVAAFGFTLHAFGEGVPLTTLAILYLVSNTAGSIVPTPGGVGAVETALTAGLRTAGVATSAALATAVVFRVLTFWIRVPLGWLALRHLNKRNLV